MSVISTSLLFTRHLGRFVSVDITPCVRVGVLSNEREPGLQVYTKKLVCQCQQTLSAINDRYHLRAVSHTNNSQ